MSYFSFLRSTSYSFTENDPSISFETNRVKDITQRFKLVNYIRSTKLESSQFYFIEDGERPDVVSYKLYGKSDLHWLLFLFNDIINPLFDWPLSSKDMQKNIEEKYEGSSIFVNIFGLEYFDEDAITITCRGGRSLFNYENYRIESGNKIFLVQNQSDTSEDWLEGELLSFDLSLGEIRVKFKTEDFDAVSPDTNRVSPDSYHSILIRTKDLSGREVDVEIKNSVFVILKESRFSVHHFETEDGILLSPLFYFSDANNQVFEGRRNRIESIANGTFTPLSDTCFFQTLLGTYLLRPNFPTKFVVTKEANDFNLNETRRKIRFPDSEYVPEMIKEIRNIFRD